MKKSLKDLIDAIPKVELHVHIEGTLEPELAIELAARNHVQLPYRTVQELRQAYTFTCLDSFLAVYYRGCSVLQTAQDFYDLTWAYLTRAHRDKVVYAEIFFDPQSHTQRGVAFDTVVDGITQALEDAQEVYGIRTKLIMCFLRHLSVLSAAEMLDTALDYMHRVPQHRIVAVGLDSSELEHPPAPFAGVFNSAVASGLRVTVHAGEKGPPEFIRSAIDDLGAERIDHGVRCLEDEDLVCQLVKEQIPLTVCPLSNVRLCCFERLEDHTLRHMLAVNLIVSCHSDDPAYFGGYIQDNVALATKHLGLTKANVMKLAENAIDSAFLTDGEKAELHDRLAIAAKPFLSS